MPDNNLPPVPPLRGWPTDNDLSALLESCGVVDTTGAQFQKLDLQAKIEAAIDTFEERTQWTPFLADGEAYTRTYDFPAGGYLNLDSGLISITSVSSCGQPLTAGLNFVAKPDNAPQRKKPYTSLALRAGLPVGFGGVASGLRRTVEVTGVWGCALSVPASVADAVLGYAAVLCVPQVALMVSGGQYKIEDVQYASGSVSPLSSERAMWAETFNQTTSFHKRVRL